MQTLYTVLRLLELKGIITESEREKLIRTALFEKPLTEKKCFDLVDRVVEKSI